MPVPLFPRRARLLLRFDVLSGFAAGLLVGLLAAAFLSRLPQPEDRPRCASRSLRHRLPFPQAMPPTVGCTSRHR